MSSTRLILGTLAIIALGMLIGWPAGYFLAVVIPPGEHAPPPEVRQFSGGMWGLILGGCVGTFTAAFIAWWFSRGKSETADSTL